MGAFTSRTMRAIVIERFGGADELKLRKLPPPKPLPGEVRIRVAHAGVNPVDWKIREGYLRDLLPHQFPLIPGWDAAGEIESIGEGVTRFSEGDPVYAMCRKPVAQWGTYAELVTMDSGSVAPMPKGLTTAQAAGVPLVSLTAWQVLHDFARIAPGAHVLVHAGAGGVGGFAIQLAKLAGAVVTATASHDKHDYVSSLGTDHLIDYQAEDFVAAGKRIAPRGFDIVLDTVGGETQERSWEATQKGGVLVSIVSTPDATRGQRLGVRSGYHFVFPNGNQLREISALIESGQLKMPRVQELPLEKAGQAHHHSQSGRTVGKIVLKI